MLCDCMLWVQFLPMWFYAVGSIFAYVIVCSLVQFLPMWLYAVGSIFAYVIVCCWFNFCLCDCMLLVQFLPMWLYAVWFSFCLCDCMLLVQFLPMWLYAVGFNFFLCDCMQSGSIFTYVLIWKWWKLPALCQIGLGGRPSKTIQDVMLLT